MEIQFNENCLQILDDIASKEKFLGHSVCKILLIKTTRNLLIASGLFKSNEPLLERCKNFIEKRYYS